MIHIPTTATLVEKLKKQAKALKKQESCSHSKALELAAHNAGYESWLHVKWCYDQSSAAKLEKHPTTE
jgi:hypothetical protein